MREQDLANLRDRIIQVARELFVARGYHAISMREIAEAVGASKAALYYHFQDKEALFLAVLSADLRDLGRRVAEARASGQTTEVRLRAVVRSILSLPPEQRAIIRLASQEMTHISAEARQTFYAAYREQFISPIAEVLAEGMALGDLRQADPVRLTWILLGMMYPFFYPAHAVDLGNPVGAVDLIVEVFLRGAGS
ncbi:MAG: TetR/AcrR family transcriptional regulator [Anaerolineae bacterium]|nr:TetR/AcrR family transcriptional regulator [Anaerolineae bacterium]MDW8098437.1 TetR/AcrR family transcriptional regulator [Anaerolineae bacterium]